MLRSNMRRATLVVVATIGAAMAGCGGGSSSTTSSTASRDGGTLTIALDAAVDSLNPQTAITLPASDVFPNVFESLLSVTPDGSVEPALATSYRYEPKRRRISFALDPKARFSNGEPVTSADVAFSVKVWQKGEIYGGYYQSIKGVRTPDPSHVVFELNAPNAGLVGVLATSNASVYPKDYAGVPEQEYWRAPIGSGPYKVASAKLNRQIDLVRNPHFRVDGAPHFDKVEIRVIPDANQRLLQFQAGKLDIVNHVAGDVAPQYPAGSIKETLSTGVDVLIANTRDPATSSAQLRQAISKALDRQALVDGAFGGSAEVATTVEPQVIPGVKACESCAYGERDVAAARALAQQAGYDGRPLELLVPAAGGLEALAAQAMPPMLAEAGIEVKVTPVETTMMLDRLQKGDYQLVLTNYNSLGPSPLDPLGFLASTAMLFTSADVASAKQAIAGIEASSDLAGMERATAAFEQTAYDTAAVIPVAALKGLWAVSDRVQGFAPPAFHIYNAGGLSAAK